jgi:receptor-binding and translocation channel-forming TcA subunit of Tc toxin
MPLAWFWSGSGGIVWLMSFTWYPFYHPYTALFIRELNRSGVDGLLNRRIQRFPASYPPGTGFDFQTTYHPSPVMSGVDVTAQTEVVDFSRGGAYAIYNWEIFFHAPMLVAAKLTANQRFEEAMRWYHRIFDPTNAEAVSAPQRYWITKPFFDQNSDDYRRQRIEELLGHIAANLDQVREWKNDPFKPFLIARHRPVAFQRAIVMRYIDNLIAWGDQLFRRDTLESINEATLLYTLAAELLGRRPERVPAVEHAELSYRELVAGGALDPFGNTQVEVLMENFVVAPDPTAPGTPGPPLPIVSVFYFGIPTNDTLLGYWDTVADRLFKVRHCMNIEGVVRQLPLFEPPIDPALLVKAAAAGVDLSSVLGLTAGPISQYRFRHLADRAAMLCAEVRALGERLLAALERRDAEALALLHAGNELSVLNAVKAVRQQQIDEALQAQAALEKGLAVLDKRIEYYGGIPRMNEWEIAATALHGGGIVSEIVATVLSTLAGGTALIPQISAGATGFGGSPALHVQIGGQQVSTSSKNFAAMFSGLAGILHHGADMLATQGTYTRQDDANQFSTSLAGLEKDQLNVQISAAAIRYAIAVKELDNHELAITNSQAVEEYLTSKYTNTQLYDWLLARLSTVYFQAYQLAFDMARRAERSFQLELAAPTASFIQFGYWDSLKKGLLSAERLTNDLRRMEAAYLDRHTREFELTKHVSLAEVDPMALLSVKLNGSAAVTLPEWLFDLDYPGHYRRRLRSVGLSIPCVVGPYTGVNCTLALTSNGVRLTDATAGGYGDPLTGTDERFLRSPIPIAAIATSHAANDRGVHELRFDDERYLPFEFAGAVSQWQIDLPRQQNRFDLASITDIVLHLDYTAVPGGTGLVEAAKDNIDAVLPTAGSRLFLLDETFATAWYRFLHPDAGHQQVMRFTLGPDHLPFWAKARLAGGATLRVTGVDILLDSTQPQAYTGTLALPTATGAAGTPAAVAGPVDPVFGGAPHLASTPTPPAPMLGDWQLQLATAASGTFTDLTEGDVRHAYLVVRFSAT